MRKFLKNKFKLLITVCCICPVLAYSTGINIKKTDSCFNLAEALYEAGEISTCYFMCNQIIEEKETTKCFDSIYINALYRMLTLDQIYCFEHSFEVISKLQIHDPNFPIVKYSNGYLILENVPSEMLKDNWIKEIFQIFGKTIKDEDIKIEGNTIQISMPACFCRPLQTSD